MAGEVVAKVSDLGFSSIWARPDDLMPVPRTETWSAPEWHHRAVEFSEAKMDVFSFGNWLAISHTDPPDACVHTSWLMPETIGMLVRRLCGSAGPSLDSICGVGVSTDKSVRHPYYHPTTIFASLD